MTLKLNVIVSAMLAAGMCVCPAFAANAPSDTSRAPAAGQSAATPQQDQAAAPDSTDAKKDAADKTDKKKQGREEKLVQTLDAITVVGFTRSIESSIAYQRYSDKIENVVTAADIGGLPDQSIADALTRLPGVAAERISGQA